MREITAVDTTRLTRLPCDILAALPGARTQPPARTTHHEPENPQTVIRHFTSTGFVVHDGATLLHWHKKVQEWLPPGGHIAANEDPAEATLREILEETGLQVEIIPTQHALEIGNLSQVAAPFAVMIEPVTDAQHGEHQHIDFIYFTSVAAVDGPPPAGWHWMTRRQLEDAATLQAPDGRAISPPEDVLKLGMAAIDHVTRALQAQTAGS